MESSEKEGWKMATRNQTQGNTKSFILKVILSQNFIQRMIADCEPTNKKKKTQAIGNLGKTKSI